MNVTNQNPQKLLSNAIMAIAILIVPATLTICGGLGQSVPEPTLLPTLTPIPPTPSPDVEATVVAGIAATQQAEANIQATIDAAVVATQAVSQSIEMQQAPSIPDPEQVRQVILNEVNGAIAQDLNLLKSLYAPGAIVIDHKGTPDNLSDDTTWRGWVNIEQRYLAFFSAGFSSLTLVDLSIQMEEDRATGRHQGVVLDGTMYPDDSMYTLEKIDGQWLITQLEFGNKKGYNLSVDLTVGKSDEQSPRDDGLYTLALGSQHRYEEPWGWDRGDPCEAWETENFDDTKPDYRGFNVELLLTNNSDTKMPDAWPISFTTAKGKSVKACYYGYEGSGPPPGATSSVTFFTVVEKGDYVETITFSLNNQTVQICLDGNGGWSGC